MQPKLLKAKTEVTPEVLVRLQLLLIGALCGSAYATAVKEAAERGQEVSEGAQ